MNYPDVNGNKSFEEKVMNDFSTGRINMEKQNYTKLYELLKEARDEADAEELTRISESIEVLLELITHRCARK